VGIAITAYMPSTKLTTTSSEATAPITIVNQIEIVVVIGFISSKKVIVKHLWP